MGVILHHAPTEHRDTDHKGPARDSIHDPKSIAHGGRKTELGQLAVVWVEEPIVQVSGRLEAILV